jgi:outer membrane murein-binding lipoprotein Lpp
MKACKFLTVAAAVCLAGVFLSGCKSEEQGRVLRYKPGVYQGKPDQQLSDARQRELRTRALMQSGSVKPTGGGGGGGGDTRRDVRKPDAPSIDLQQLGNRARLQGGAGL